MNVDSTILDIISAKKIIEREDIAPRIREEGDFVVVDAKGLHYRILNEIVYELIEKYKKIKLINVNGQRYIADGLKGDYYIEIYGTAGDDLGAFMNGPTIVVHGNVQDGAGNTMNAGKIIVHGNATDILGHSMRGGVIYVNGDVGYRVGVHMKEYKEQVPIIVAGGTAGDFLGEYMAGGRIIILGLKRRYTSEIVGDWIAAGIHGGVIYIRDVIEEDRLGYGAKIAEFTEEDKKYLSKILKEYCNIFNYDLKKVLNHEFTKIVPESHRPYGKMYTD